MSKTVPFKHPFTYTGIPFLSMDLASYSNSHYSTGSFLMHSDTAKGGYVPPIEGLRACTTCSRGRIQGEGATTFSPQHG